MCFYSYIYGAPAFSSLGGNCASDSTIGQSCQDSNGVNAYYAGTCSHDSLAPSSPTTGGTWQSYYNNSSAGYAGTGTDGNNYNASGTSQADPACTNGNSNLYVTQTGPPLSYCNSNGGVADCTHGQNTENNCTLTAAEAQAWGYGNSAICNLSFQSAVNYCASLGSGWQLPSEDELHYIYSNDSSYGANAISTLGGYYLSSTESSTADAYVVEFNNGSQFPGGAQGYWGIRCVKSSS